MAEIDRLAQAALDRDAFLLRSLAQDLLRKTKEFRSIAAPSSQDARMRAAAASIVELLALRANQSPPDWAALQPGLSEPFHLLKSAESMRRIRKICEEESPEPLLKRGFYAPPDFLTFA